MHPTDYNCPFHGLFMNVSTQIIACCSYRLFLSTFFPTHFDRGLKLRLLFATMGIVSS
jgi:hypothetical protein